MRKYSIIYLLALTALACNDNNGNSHYSNAFNNSILYCKTVKELNNVVMGNNFPPIIASRNYAYASIAAYECIVVGDNNYQSLAGQIKHLKPFTPPDTANVNFQMAALLAFCKVGEAVTFPEGSMGDYVANLKKMADSIDMPSKAIKATQTMADSVAAHIIRWSKQDNYAQLRSAPKYTVTQDEGRWVPTPPAYSQALEPHWREMRPLVMDSATQFIPPRPMPFNIKDKNSAYYKEVMSVKNAGDSLSDEQKHIAEFWDDLANKLQTSGHVMFVTKKFSPPGHWMNIVGIAAEKSKADFNTTVSAYALTSIAIFDAFIQCWDEKFRSNTVRPETVINKYIDQDWRPYLQTPPFPEYTCGHSTVSSAAAEALTEVFGDNFNYVDSSELEFGIKNRSFTSFRQAADENNWARFYGGIHFHSSCLVSTEYGKKVGVLITNRVRLRKKP